MQKQRSITGEDLLNMNQVAELLGLKRGTIRDWLLQRRLPYVRLSRRAIRVRRADVVAFIEKSSVAARRSE